MNLTEFAGVCARLEAFCIYARRRAPYGEPELLERAAALEAALLEEYNTAGEGLALSCVEVAGTPVRAELVARYRERFAVSGQIQTLADDLAGGAVSCPENLRGRLILAVKGLVSLVSSLSLVCGQEFDKMEPRGARSGQDFREVIEGNQRAREVCERLRAAGFLDAAYKFFYMGRGKGNPTREEEGAAARELAGYFSGEVAPIAQHWGIDPRLLSTYMDKAHNNPQRVERVTRAIKGETV